MLTEIERLRHQIDLSRKELSDIADVSLSRLKDAENEMYELDLFEFRRIAKALGASSKTLYLVGNDGKYYPRQRKTADRYCVC